MRRLGAVGAAAAAAAVLGVLMPAGPTGADPSSLPERSRLFEAVAETAGCGPTAGLRDVDGDLADWPASAGGVNGTGYYAGGEYVWTDYVADDAGTGFLVYPGEYDRLEAANDGSAGRISALTNRYGSSAADLVETRFAADGTTVAAAAVLNFLNAIDTTVVAFGFDVDGDPTTETDAGHWPLGARLRTPGADVFVTAHPTAGGFCGTVTTASGDTAIDAAGGAVAVDTATNTIEITFPRSILGPAARVSVVGGSGVWDMGGATWKQPLRAADSPNAPEEVRGGEPTDVRGGVTDSDPAVFNLLFRGDEDMVDPGNGADAAEASSRRAFEHLRQAAVLQGGTSGPYALDLDLSRVEPGAAAEPVPTRRGDRVAFTRQYRSNLGLEGIVWVQNDISLDAIYLGPRQSYAVHLPPCLAGGSTVCPAAGVPMWVSFHGGSGSHVNQIEESVFGVTSMAERGEVLTMAPLGRGRRAPWWRGPGELDVLEAIADVESAYPIDSDRRLAAGGSLGGYASLRFGSLYPDLWSGVGAFCPATYENSTSAREPGNEVPETQQFTVFPLLGSLVNTPFLQVSGTIDPLVRIGNGHRLRDRALGEGLDLRYTEWGNGHHCTWVPETQQRFWDWHVTEMLDMLDRGRPSQPAIVRYAVDPRQFVPGAEPVAVADIRDIGVRHDGAWWVSQIEVRGDVIERATAPPAIDLAGNTLGGAGDDVVGQVSAVSHARPGWTNTPASCGDTIGLAGISGNPKVQQTPGGSSGRTYPDPHSFVCQTQVRSTPALEAVFDLAVTHLASLTVDVSGSGAGLPGAFTLHATGDGEVTVTLAGGSASSAAGTCVTGQQVTPAGLALTLSLTDTPCTVAVT